MLIYINYKMKSSNKLEIVLRIKQNQKDSIKIYAKLIALEN